MNRADLRESRAFDDVIQGGQEVREQGEDTVPDDGSDQPSSPRQSEDHETSFSADISDYEQPTMPMSTFQTAAIDCNSENNVQDQPSPGERQRPLRNASRPMRFRDAAFNTQFQPKLRQRNCKKIRRQGTTGNYVINKEEYSQLGRGEKQRPLIAIENKEATTVAKRQQTASTVSFQPKKNTRQSSTASVTLQKKRYRYPRSHRGRIKSAVPLRRPENLEEAPSPAEMSKTHQRCSRITRFQSEAKE